MPYNTLVVLFGGMALGALCGAMGVLGVLRRQALLSDVIGHASLFGIVGAFLLFQVRATWVLLLGALLSGLLGVLWLSRANGRRPDGASALVLAATFGLGIVLSRLAQNQSGGAARAGLDTFLLGKAGSMVLIDAQVIFGLALLVLVGFACILKELRLLSFDGAFAGSVGRQVARADVFLGALLTLTVVLTLPMVGVIFAAALLILPPIAARFWVVRLGHQMALAAAIGAASAGLGIWMSSIQSGLPTGPTIVLVAGSLMLLSAFLAPTTGILATAFAHRLQRSEEEAIVALRALTLGRDPGSGLSLARERGWVTPDKASPTPEGVRVLAERRA